ncbi:MAG: TetR/AcrR family transcriptional regulator [Bifidobacteriaceae bacterium]|jgi:AcrR family transcriptional regulator|nr:TetR/AcrR family transcriptional regulator [Bifidobacteriaceae bacterium]
MGLREKKAAQTRARVIDTALRLFSEKGYDATTVEEIAAEAEIGTSTFYRFFPTKDAVLVEPLRLNSLAEALRSRPPDEPIDQALGAAILTMIQAGADDERLETARTILDATPGPRARLWDLWAAHAKEVGQVIAERTAVQLPDLATRFAGMLAMTIGGMAADLRRAREFDGTAAEIAARIMRELVLGGVTLPLPAAVPPPPPADQPGRRS